MAMFLSRIKQVLNLGTKSITSNGTYNASSDGYDGYSSVNVAIPTPTSITPSNASPAALTSGNAVTPSANGYAIESYDSVTPSSTPTSVSTNDVVKIGGSGVIVDSIPTPPSITPSNSTPASLTSGSAVTPTANGYAIQSYFSVTPSSIASNVASGDIIKIGGTGIIISDIPTITPSNNNPVSLSAGNPVKPTASGYAIQGYSSKTPSDSSPASILGGAIFKASASGYLYASSGLKKVKTGSVSLTANTNNTITTGFQPKYICWNVGTGSLCAYNEDISTTQFRKASSSGISNVNVGTSASYNLISISSTGFVIRGASSAVTMNYFAIG